MSQYVPNPPPQGADIAGLRDWMVSELDRLAVCLSQPDERQSLKVLYAVPTKYSPGDVIYADGVRFNPGSGEGMYVRNLANTLWKFLG